MDFFVFLGTELSTSSLISPSLTSVKRFFSVFHDQLKFSLNVCSFLGLSSK